MIGESSDGRCWDITGVDGHIEAHMAHSKQCKLFE